MHLSARAVPGKDVVLRYRFVQLLFQRSCTRFFDWNVWRKERGQLEPAQVFRLAALVGTVDDPHALRLHLVGQRAAHAQTDDREPEAGERMTTPSGASR